MANRHRAVSLSLDWDNIVKGDETVKIQRDRMPGGISYERPTVEFCTGSSYTGKWNSLGMADYGSYIFPHGCEYEGEMDDGMFHGEGYLMYPMGQRLEGVWDKGRLVSYKFSHIDGLDYEEPWNYCKMPDRRFNVTLREGLQPAGREFLTNQQPTRNIEPGCYDTGDGFYNPETKCIFPARDPADYINLEQRDSVEVIEQTEEDLWVNSITMVPPERDEWIRKNCRKGWDEPAGYRPDLYENWITGRKAELDELEAKYKMDDQSRVNPNSIDSSSLNSDNIEIREESSLDYACTGRKLSPLKNDLITHVFGIKK